MTPITMTGFQLRRTERHTLVLTAVYLLSLAVVYALDETTVWLFWAVVVVLVTGGLLVSYNRSTPVESA
ncbi:hypothetical protein [Natronobacterium gregoryi]|uniref:Uncharacterized protein n=3 Tax=Natronobacterium gregoryi TaxID=44930 RepID=L9YEK9_NATGS|nr:hypothetical protein [Natronobacterium gregoryi]ELY72525.1 hypothetical protein C490_03003 [Natronobacterium gregoryi SP2]